MITVLVPTFDEFNGYAFTGYAEVKIKNKPDFHDVNAICKRLPGIPCGAIGPNPLQDLMNDGKREVRAFYDGRQKTTMLRGYHVTLKPTS